MRQVPQLLLDQFSREVMVKSRRREGNTLARTEGCTSSKAEARYKKKSSRPTVPCDGPRMNPSVDVGCPPRPFRHLRMAQRRTPDLSSSRAPVHSALVQKSVTAITNPAGRLSIWMLGKMLWIGKWKTRNSWQVACNQSNEEFTKGLYCVCRRAQADRGGIASAKQL
jgi:hypothetical protein